MIKLLCPKCGKELNRVCGVWSCKNGHSYDVAKEGYVNLLLANMKNSKNPGDNKLMAMARDKFLSGGYYDFLAEFIAQTVSGETADKNIDLLDCGCGSGFYLRRILCNKKVSAAAVDISKEAVKIASKKDKASVYAVASVYELPFEDCTFDVAVCVFSPYAYKEYARVLKSGGVLIVVYPAEKHLYEIKQRLYQDSVYENEKDVSSPLFEKPLVKTVSQKLSIEGNDLLSLIQMTPYYYTTHPDAVNTLLLGGKIEVTASFKIAVLKKP